MTWLRIGDTFATDPRVLALHDPAEPLLGPACVGFFLQLATLSAAQQTDYLIAPGFLTLAGGAAAQQLLKHCTRVGLITSVGGRGISRRWKLIDDAPELIHIRLRAEVAWERQQKADTQDPRNLVAVLLRDGESCRYCGKVVQPNDNRSGRGRTVDHVYPTRPARTADDLVVACRECNGRRGREWQDESSRDGFAARWPLRQPPTPLIFHASTVNWLESKGHTVPPGSVIAEPTPGRRKTAGPATTTPGQEAPRSATQAAAAAPGQGTTAPDDPHPALQAGVATPDADTTSATHPTPQVGVAALRTTAAQHPASQAGVAAAGTTAPDGQHPAPAGVAAPEARTDRTPTARSGTAVPGRVGHGSGGLPLPPPPPARPTTRASPDQPTASTPPRRTRRGRRSPRSSSDQLP